MAIASSSSASATRASATPLTRHNVGFEFAAELSRRWDLPKAKTKFGGLLSEGRAGSGGPAGRDPAAADADERLR